MSAPLRFLMALLLACLLPGVGHAANIEGVFLLNRSPDGFHLSLLPLAEGETQVVRVGPGSDVVSVLLPPATGRSSSLETSAPGLRVVSRRGGVITLEARSSDGRSTISSWSNRVEDLTGYDIRVSVTSPERKQAFLIHGYSTSAATVGPVFNPFVAAGMPRPGEVVVETDTTLSVTPREIIGSAPFRFSRFPLVQLSIGGRMVGWAVVDTGAAVTVISDSVVPAGTEVRQVQIATYSPAGRSTEPLAIGGAGGAVAVAGEAGLAGLSIGAVEMGPTDVLVIAGLSDTMKSLTGEEIVAVIGLDVLRRSERVVFDFEAGSDMGELRFEPSRQGGMPMSIAGQHLFVEGQAGSRVNLLVDTGSSAELVLDPASARAAGFRETGDAAPARGLDGAALQFQTGVVERLTIGALEWSDVSARRGGVPVFNTMQNREQNMALLGSGFLRRLDRVALDFVTLKVEFTP